MIYRIIQYIQPWEIDDFERQVDQLIKSSYYLDPVQDTIILDVTMNVGIVDWQSSELPLTYFLDKFKYLQTKTEHYFQVEFDTNSAIQGCTDKRRVCSYKTQDFVIWLDSDVFFPVQLLPLLVLGSKQLPDSSFILTPQIIRYWDSSWDCITNPAFLNQPHNHRDFFDLYSVDSLTESQEQQVVKNNTVKFGGGWFNLLKSTIFSRVPLVDELGPYAPDDTYLSMCSMKLNIPQYILTGITVSEVGKKFLTGKDYIKKHLVVKIQDKDKISDQQLHTLISDFYAKH